MNIKKASEVSGLSSDTIRYYERIGIIPPIPRNTNGIREFGEQELGWLEFTKHFRDAGMSIESLVEYIKLFQQGDETIPARIEILQEQHDLLQEKLENLQYSVNRLEFKIKNYKNVMVPYEKALSDKISKP